MAKFQVSYVIRDWISINVDADNEEQAKVKTEKIANSIYNKTPKICINDGKTDYVGITNLDVLDLLDI